jgi:ATP-dependent RNA helicase HelY
MIMEHPRELESPLPGGSISQTIADFAARYPFPLDEFQLQALHKIAEGSSVIVSAPTGAGKTLIAEFAIWLALCSQRRIGYTTPLKALSNQKYGDFQQEFGEEQVGILTGDVKMAPQAPVLVMTTEILRNMFYERSFPEMAYVVLDECHFIGDEGRGTVWEEIIINCPQQIRLVALSATVSNIREIAAWIEEVHGPIEVIYHPTRPVPLEFLFCDKEAKMVSLTGMNQRQLEQSLYKGQPRPQRRGRRGRSRDLERFSMPRRPANPSLVIPSLEARRWLPAIYFIFSRAGCEQALQRFLEEGGNLLKPGERERVEEIIEATLLECFSLNLESELNAALIRGLKRGVGVHHAGILPALKRLTETLFEQGLVKVVFATETMSLGIHMPAKSVVLQGVSKRSDFGFRNLTHNEITQMGGRAGRRGIDPEGKCIVALESKEAIGETLRLIRGRPEPIESQFRIGYSSAALLLRSYPDEGSIRVIVESSFGQFQNRKKMEELKGGIEESEEKVNECRSFTPFCGDLQQILTYRQVRDQRGKPSKGRESSALKLEEMACHRCLKRGECERRLRRCRRWERSLEGKKQELRLLANSYWEQFLRVKAVLQRFGYVKDHGLSQEGRLIASLRHDNELLVARIVFSDILESLRAAEMAAILSCVVDEPRSRDALIAKVFLRAHPQLKRKLRQMEGLAEEIFQVQKENAVFLPLNLHTNFVAAAYEWASGEDDWVRLVSGSFGGHEGDLIRSLRRLIDLCRQLIDAPTLPPSLGEKLWQITEMLDRGIVWESALI